MRFFFWICFFVYWSFLILAPLNAFAEDKTFTCKPVVAGSPKKDGNFYIEDIHEESTPMLDVMHVYQLLIRGEHVFLKNNPSRDFEILIPYKKLADMKEIRDIQEGLRDWDEMLSFDNFRSYYLRYIGGGDTESLKRISINGSNTKTAVITIPMEDYPSYFSLANCEAEITNKNIQIEYDPSKIVS